MIWVKRSLGQGNIFSSVCQEFCSQGGGSASVHAGIPNPSSLGPGTSRDQAPPLAADTFPLPPPGPKHPLRRSACWGDTVNKWPVCILLECNLVCILFCSIPQIRRELWKKLEQLCKKVVSVIEQTMYL